MPNRHEITPPANSTQAPTGQPGEVVDPATMGIDAQDLLTDARMPQGWFQVDNAAVDATKRALGDLPHCEAFREALGQVAGFRDRPSKTRG